MEVVAIVPAAGSGERLGLNIPKALIEIGGKSIIERTIATLSRVQAISQLFVLAPPEQVELMREVISSSGADTQRIQVIAGGSTRQESVSIGLKAIHSDRAAASKEFLILIHDAARCLVSIDLIERCIAGARTHAAVTAGIRSIDSVKRIDRDGRVAQSLNRSEVVLVQTPQVFRFDLVWKAHGLVEGAAKVGLSRIESATDDASLVEHVHPVTVVWGETSNIKITTKADLEMARLLLARQE